MIKILYTVPMSMLFDVGDYSDDLYLWIRPFWLVKMPSVRLTHIYIVFSPIIMFSTLVDFLFYFISIHFNALKPLPFAICR